MHNPIDRRVFMVGAGVLFAASLTSHSAEVLNKSEAIFAATCKTRTGKFAAVLFDEKMQIIKQVALPDRGHDIVFNPVTGDSVVFARRPGNFAVALDASYNNTPQTIISPEGRHFYGHGVFSSDGQLLYATENHFEGAVGVIGIYDATNHFKRLGELPSHGIGPHDILLSSDGKTLIVANGGIETHPDYGRAKLNLSTMKPSIAYIDRSTGALLEKHELCEDLYQLSIRHMAMNNAGTVVFGCQYEGAKGERPPMIGKSQFGVGIETFSANEQSNWQSQNYIGSVAVSADGKVAAVSAPRDNAAAILSVEDGRVISVNNLQGVCGLSAGENGFVASSDQGFCGEISNKSAQSSHDLVFDNHMAARDVKIESLL